MGLKSILANMRSRGLKDVTNPSKIKNYFDGQKIFREGLNLEYDEVLSYSEQLVYRSIVCRKCFTDGRCEHCKCIQPMSGMVFNHECSLEKYHAMMPTDEWEEYKKETGLKFELVYGK